MHPKNKALLGLVLMGLFCLWIAGCGSGSSAPSTPGAPTGVVATPASCDWVTITWNPVAGATYYNLYWSMDPGVTPANGVKIVGVKSPHTQSIAPGYPYFYVLTAVNSVGESVASSEVSVILLAPDTPTGTNATPGNRQVQISWTAVPGADFYNIYYSTMSGGGSRITKIARVSNPNTVIGLSNGTTYYFVVTAENVVGESYPSSEVSAVPQGPAFPAAPSNVIAVGLNGEADIGWPAVAGVVSYYNIYWSTTDPVVTPANGAKIGNIIGTDYNHTGLTNGTTYYYVVTAVNANGESAASPVTSATPAVSTAPFIQATVVTTSPPNQRNWLEKVNVYTDSTKTTPITNATVTVNGQSVPLSTQQDYIASIPITPGQQVMLSVQIGNSTYTATGTQYSTFPSVSTPNAFNATWQAASDKTISWTAGTPTAGAMYSVGVIDLSGNTVYPPGGENTLFMVPTSSTTFLIPANSLAAGSYFVDVFIATANFGVVTGITNAAPGSYLTIAGEAPWVPFTIQSSTAPNVSGNWTGTYTSQVHGAGPGTISITQTGASISGTVSTTFADQTYGYLNISGTITGTVDGTTITATQVNLSTMVNVNGTNHTCTGTFSGSAAVNTQADPMTGSFNLTGSWSPGVCAGVDTITGTGVLEQSNELP